MKPDCSDVDPKWNDKVDCSSHNERGPVHKVCEPVSLVEEYGDDADLEKIDVKLANIMKQSWHKQREDHSPEGRPLLSKHSPHIQIITDHN